MPRRGAGPPPSFYTIARVMRARAREDEMVEVWLLMVAILGPERGDIRFYHPRVEFPTMASCRRQAAQVSRDYTDDVHQVVTACAMRLAADRPSTEPAA